ncbi:glycosyltransferase [Achromobacter sp. GD03932]|uniref:glycosyltransferase n=1 Tax=Achromobacter sp. GD03932 TaxID=2975407 RepID=UPI002449AD3F|nr:glycosyltransferase [Achromobacter sp. GD03932]MDH1301114.1 glycosyltransferase [Achromobacter sp. GD03932]
MDASIVVLTYNNLNETTAPCLESIIANTDLTRNELIVVDNASADGTREYLLEFQRKYPFIHLRLNETNKGYAGGNNDGMKMARGEVVVLLNNDTLVPPGWLPRLTRLFTENKQIGLIGPVTNSAGNEQRLELDGVNENTYEEITSAYIQRHQGVWFATERLGFYCVAVHRRVIEKIGYLDEGFGLGMFEDDDYCVRARRAGFVLAVIEDCFVYHKGSVSFGKLATQKYKALFERNKALYTKKHDVTWSFSEIALSYWEKLDKDLRVMFEGPRTPEAVAALERIELRWENFRHLLVQVHSAEVSNQISGGQPPAVLARSKWQTRWFNFRRNVLRGTWRERVRYGRYIASRLAIRAGVKGAESDPSKELMEKVRRTLGNLEQRRVVIFPATIDYSYMRQRPQSLAKAFADMGFLVIYGTLNHTTDKVKDIEEVSPGLFVVQEWDIFPLLPHILEPGNVIYYCLWPNNLRHVEYLPYSRLVYDYMDDLCLLDLPSEQVEAMHDEMLQRADLITVSAQRLYDTLPADRRDAALILPNAVGEEFIAALAVPQAVPEALKDFERRPVSGYYGALAPWIDFELLEHLADSLPDHVLVIIGPVLDGADESLNSLCTRANVRHFPAMEQLDLVPYLQRFDLCLIPFVVNQITNSVSPVKLYEYLAAGKPVIATATEECGRIPFVKIAVDKDDFVTLVRSSSLLEAEAAESRAYAASHTWSARAAEVASRLKLDSY